MPDCSTRNPRIGVIGTGMAGTGHAAQLWFAGDTELTAACSRNSAGLEVFCDRFDIGNAFTDYTVLIEAGGLDAIVIATAHNVLADATMQAMRAGLDILVEKPMASGATEAAALLHAQGQSRSRVLVAYPRRFRNHYISARSWIAEGRLGPLRHAALEWCDVHMASYLDTEFQGAANFRLDPQEAVGGVLLDHGSHMLDALFWLAGDPAVRVAAWLGAGRLGLEAEAIITLHLQGGAAVSAHVYPAVSGRQDRRISLQGAEARLVINDYEAVLLKGRDAVDRVEHVPDQAALRHGFMTMIAGGDSGGCTVAEAAHVVTVIDAAYRSAAQGGQAVDL